MEAVNALLAVPFWSVAIGSMVCGAIAWLVAWWYYRKAALESRVEARKSRSAADLVLYCLTNKDARTAPIRDANGHVSGLTVNIAGSANMSMQAGGNLSRAPRRDP